MSFFQNHGLLQQTVKKSVTLSASNHAIELDEPDIDDLLDGETEFSISFWFKPNTALNTNGNLFSSLSSGGGNDGWALEVESSTELRLWAIDNFGLGGYFRLTFTHSMTSGNWYHIVVTYDGSNDAAGANVYINGTALSKVVDVDNLNFPYNNIENQDDLQIGNGNFFGGVRTGAYDELTVWEKELSAGEVTTLYNSGVPGNPRIQLGAVDLRSWFRFDEDRLFYPNVRDSQGNVDATYINIPITNITTDVLE